MQVVRAAFLVVISACIGAAAAHAQAPAPIHIPLQLIDAPAVTTGTPFPEQYRLVINVGINGGAALPYLFDTGSALFNAQYNTSWWPGITPGTDPAKGYAPNSTVPNGTGVEYCYGNGIGGCRGFQGNIVQAEQLDFYYGGPTPVLASTLNATPGYQISAVYNLVYEGVPTLVAGTTAPMHEGIFYGTFGAGNFTYLADNYMAGSVLGQTTVTGVGQGYVVAANGQPNPITGVQNPPQKPLGQTVTIGGATQQVTSCSPCVTLGVTPQMLGQFAPVRQPTPGNTLGMVPWVNSSTPFPNPYGGSTGNNASEQFGYRFLVGVAVPGGPSATTTAGALLDTGTGGFTLSTVFNQPGMSDGVAVLGGSTLTATGVSGPAGNASPVVGLSTSSSVLQPNGTHPINYVAQFDARTPGTTNTIGLPFFLQNSVLFDLDNKAVGYTPFFVTDAPLATTAGGPLIVTGDNVPLGLAGVISGLGGLQINGGGAVQVSATNTYGGLTSIFGGQLLISGPGSIASSSGVQNEGLFDISRAWGAVMIQSLSGTSNGVVSLGGNNLVIANANGTFSGTLGDGGYYPGTGGSLTLMAGTQSLGGVNSYTGGTTVNGGTLRLGAVGSLPTGGALAINGGTVELNGNDQTIGALSGAGGILSLGGATLTAGNSASSVFGGIIQGAGSLMKQGSGMLTLLGANSYGGGTTVLSGILQGNTASLQGNIVNNASVWFAQDTAGTYAGDMSGTGSLVLNGAGTLSLIGNNSYTGGTTVNGGVLSLGGPNALPALGALTINGGTVALNGNDLTLGMLVGSGGALSLGSADLTVAGGGSTTVGTVITGSGGLNLTGGGFLNLTAANTYTGPTSVFDGVLAVNGSINSDVTVGAAGQLRGSGTIFGNLNAGGVTAPGNSIGTLNVAGSYTQAAGSTYEVEVNAAGQSDLVNVTGAPGTATINGGMVSVIPILGLYAPRTTYTILSATGGVAGSYAGVGTSLPFLQSSLSYDANNVYLTLSPGGFARGAQTPNQMAVGAALDRGVAGASGDFATIVGTMAGYSFAQGQAAMSTLSGQGYSGFGTANLGGALLFMNALGQQMSMLHGGAGGQVSRTALAQACDVEGACDSSRPGPWSLWGTAMGGTGTVAGNGNAASLTYNAGGFATGLDYRFDRRLLAGIGVGFSSGNQWASGFSGQGTTNSYQASLYASFTPGAFYVDALAGYGYNDNSMTRQITLPNLAPRLAQGRTGANQFLGQVEAGYRIAIDGAAALALTPFARFQGTTVNQAGFTESGAGALNLAVAQQTSGSARSVLGAEIAGAFGVEGREKLAVQLRAGWAHEYASTARPVTANFAGAPGTNFTVFGAAPQTDSAIVSVAANTAIAASAGLYLRYDGEVGGGISSHSLSGGFRATW
ncbi:MAG: YapH protein [Rhodospirillaceae bacterium]|nr:MAG: YapH protein [Rhodospirillaceae bacterium]